MDWLPVSAAHVRDDARRKERMLVLNNRFMFITPDEKFKIKLLNSHLIVKKKFVPICVIFFIVLIYLLFLMVLI